MWPWWAELRKRKARPAPPAGSPTVTGKPADLNEMPADRIVDLDLDLPADLESERQALTAGRELHISRIHAEAWSGWTSDLRRSLLGRGPEAHARGPRA